MEPFNGIFHFINLCQTLPISLYHLQTNFEMKEKKNFCMYGCFSVSRYAKGIENRIFRYNHIFRRTSI